MEDYRKISQQDGSIEEITKREVGYNVVQFPSLDATIEKEVKYIIKGVHKDRISMRAAYGRPAIIPDVIDFSSPTFTERFKLIFSMLYHVFDDKYWSGQVSKMQYLRDDDGCVGKLRDKVDEYNNLLARYIVIDDKKIVEEKTKTVVTDKKNLDSLMVQLEARRNMMRR